MPAGKENHGPRLAAAAVASQESTVTRSSNPLHALAGAKLVLKNESDYCVSYWVVYEDKLSSTAVKRRVFRNIEDHLNDGGSDLSHAKHNAKHGWDMINAENALDNEYFVLRDERLKGDRAAGKVPFPKGSRQLRVYCYAWFEREKEWRVIRDKLCKNGRRKKTFTLKATNGTVEPFEL